MGSLKFAIVVFCIEIKGVIDLKIRE